MVTRKLTNEGLKAKVQPVYEITASDLRMLLIGSGIPSERIDMAVVDLDDGSSFLSVRVDDGDDGLIYMSFDPVMVKEG